MNTPSPYSSPKQVHSIPLSSAELENKRKLWKRATWCFLSLSTISSMPSIALLGNTVGNSFSTLSQQGIGDPQLLSAAIGETLIAAAAGLAFALPAFIFFVLFIVSLIRFRRYRARYLISVDS
jgi:biopolymer transport protein ExbB/TolQ